MFSFFFVDFLVFFWLIFKFFCFVSTYRCISYSTIFSLVDLLCPFLSILLCRFVSVWPSPYCFYYCCLVIVEDNFFTPHVFISLATYTMSTLSWILGKPLLKPKQAHIYTKRHQSPWFNLIAHHLIFWLMIQAYESHQGNSWSRGLEDQEVCSVKFQWFKIDKGKHVAWHVFPNSLNSDGSVYNR